MKEVHIIRTRKFIGALRSGTFKQCTGSMASFDYATKEDSYCALGVALKLKEKLTFQNCEEWYGWNQRIRHQMVSMNDDGKSFDEIADFLEREIS